MIWAAVLIGSFGCYLLKFAGLSVPKRLLSSPRMQKVAVLMPVALLAALIAIQTFTIGKHLVLDARAGGLAVAAIAVLLRAPFLLVVALACVATALIRLWA